MRLTAPSESVKKMFVSPSSSCFSSLCLYDSLRHTIFNINTPWPHLMECVPALFTHTCDVWLAETGSVCVLVVCQIMSRDWKLMWGMPVYNLERCVCAQCVLVSSACIIRTHYSPRLRSGWPLWTFSDRLEASVFSTSALGSGTLRSSWNNKRWSLMTE